MIGILYLVLLGLVALNVSDSLLDAFKNLGDSLNTSTQNTQTGIDNMFDTFRETKMKENPERAKPILENAEKAQNLTSNLTDKVTEYKKLLIEEGGGIDTETGDVSKRSNTNISVRTMIRGGRAAELKQLITDTKKELEKLTNNEVPLTLDAVDPPARGGVKKSWEEATFGDGIPLTAAITGLEKIIADAKNAESASVKHIFGKMDQAVVNLDRFSGYSRGIYHRATGRCL